MSNQESRMVCYIPLQDYVPEQGYRVAFVTEGEPGYRLSGNWPYDASNVEHKMPWFWGHDLDKALAMADEQNAKMGISTDDAFKIVAGSIEVSRRGKLVSVDDGAHRRR